MTRSRRRWVPLDAQNDIGEVVDEAILNNGNLTMYGSDKRDLISSKVEPHSLKYVFIFNHSEDQGWMLDTEAMCDIITQYTSDTEELTKALYIRRAALLGFPGPTPLHNPFPPRSSTASSPTGPQSGSNQASISGFLTPSQSSMSSSATQYRSIHSKFGEVASGATQQHQQATASEWPQCGSCADDVWARNCALLDCLPVSIIDDRSACLKLIWAVWREEQSQRAFECLCGLMSKSAKFTKTDERTGKSGREWVSDIISDYDSSHPRPISMATVTQMAQEAHGKPFVKRLFSRYPIGATVPSGAILAPEDAAAQAAEVAAAAAAATQAFISEIMQVTTIQPDVSYSEQYMRPDALLLTCKTALVKAPMGGGKTQLTKSILHAVDVDPQRYLDTRGGTLGPMVSHTTGAKFARVAFISGRRSFTDYAVQEMNSGVEDPRLRFTNYMEVRGGLRDYNRVFVQCESLYRTARAKNHKEDDDIIVPRYDLVVLDESETICKQMSSLTTHGKFHIANVHTFQLMVQRAKTVIAMDAYLSERTVEMLRCLRPPDGWRYIVNSRPCVERTAVIMEADNVPPCPYKKSRKVRKVRKPKAGAAVRVRGPNAATGQKRAAATAATAATTDANKWKHEQWALSLFYNSIASSLKQGKRLVVVSGSKNKATALMKYPEIQKALEGKAYRYYNADSTGEERMELKDVAKSWSTLDLLIYTPIITCGISYPSHLPPFDKLYVYATASSVCARDVLQATMRVRYIKDPRVIVYLEPRTTPRYPVGFKAVLDKMDKDAEDVIARFSSDRIHSEWLQAPEFFRLLHARNTNEDRVSNNMYRDVLRAYLEATGYTIQKPDHREFGMYAKLADTKTPKMAFEDVPDIPDNHHSEDGWLDSYERALERRQPTTLLDDLMYAKWRLLDALHPSVHESHAASVWDKVVMENKQWIGRLIMERHDTLDAKAQKEAERHYSITADHELHTRDAMKDLCTVLGIATSQEERTFGWKNWEDDIVPELAKLEDRLIEVFGLRASRRADDDVFSASHAATLVSRVLKEWAGGDVESTVTQPRIGGKRAKKHNYTIKPSWLRELLRVTRQTPDEQEG